ncbi:ATP-grasp domain-containing protein [Thiocystis violascens]|uniref:Glutathione synthase/ribosomal protein S6 modification enzyme (Glutaminyl transferase) n=1 Tax=Thiocystis violascens (strain ATCC 17096 / DSM 198 / 6111) TaxID=765911 RepID=I3Y6S7_THIV6|nr:RimK family alpha-L-glutamate ligase [Thiocystis violascens]AFL72695.1 glutathione synthase/ribosomal protein S6 modification enzyme (glutaminyl transferase) [Thiocystis violascens DSM 198]
MQASLGLANLMRRHLAGEDLTPFGRSLLARATQDPNDAASLFDAAIILQFLGNPALALQLQREALKLCRHYVIPAALPARLRLLALMAPGELMANVPIECLLENSDIELHLHYAIPGETAPADLPEHDLLFVAIGESEANHRLLTDWLPHLGIWPKPILNNPRHVARVARDTAAQRLQGLPGIVMPPTWRIARETLRQLADHRAPDPSLPAELDFPLILRPLDSHAGHDLSKTDTPTQLAEQLQVLPDDEFFVAPFIDYRSPDGHFRKYRVILIAGTPYACHMGISSHWMIHYLNAGMAESPAKRAEEAAFMADFEHAFAVRHGPALAAIDHAIGLDYLGIDCAELPDGRLLIFEVDHAMVVHAMDPVELFPYKQPAMRKIFMAFRSMLLQAAASASSGTCR